LITAEDHSQLRASDTPDTMAGLPNLMITAHPTARRNIGPLGVQLPPAVYSRSSPGSSDCFDSSAAHQRIPSKSDAVSSSRRSTCPEGRDNLDLTELVNETGVDDSDQLARSIRRLESADMVDTARSFGEMPSVMGVTERGLRESGAWPERADQLAAQLIAALAEAAEREPEPAKQSKLRADA
jgi:hypothetical protein